MIWEDACIALHVRAGCRLRPILTGHRWPRATTASWVCEDFLAGKLAAKDRLQRDEP
jgi:hypothetical protein